MWREHMYTWLELRYDCVIFALAIAYTRRNMPKTISGKWHVPWWHHPLVVAIVKRHVCQGHQNELLLVHNTMTSLRNLCDECIYTWLGVTITLYPELTNFVNVGILILTTLRNLCRRIDDDVRLSAAATATAATATTAAATTTTTAATKATARSTWVPVAAATASYKHNTTMVMKFCLPCTCRLGKSLMPLGFLVSRLTAATCKG